MALPSIEAQNTAETSIILVMLQYHLLHLSFPDTQLIMNYRLRSSQTLCRNWRRDSGAAGTTTTTSTWDAIAVPRTRGWSFFTALLRKAHGNLLLCTRTSSTTHWANLKFKIFQDFPVRLRILRKNLDWCFAMIFGQWTLFLLIDLIPGFTSYRASGIDAINWNIFYCSKIITKHWSRFLLKIR